MARKPFIKTNNLFVNTSLWDQPSMLESECCNTEFCTEERCKLKVQDWTVPSSCGSFSNWSNDAEFKQIKEGFKALREFFPDSRNPWEECRLNSQTYSLFQVSNTNRP